MPVLRPLHRLKGRFIPYTSSQTRGGYNLRARRQVKGDETQSTNKSKSKSKSKPRKARRRTLRQSLHRGRSAPRRSASANPPGLPDYPIASPSSQSSSGSALTVEAVRALEDATRPTQSLAPTASMTTLTTGQTKDSSMSSIVFTGGTLSTPRHNSALSAMSSLTSLVQSVSSVSTHTARPPTPSVGSPLASSSPSVSMASIDSDSTARQSDYVMASSVASSRTSSYINIDEEDDDGEWQDVMEVAPGDEAMQEPAAGDWDDAKTEVGEDYMGPQPRSLDIIDPNYPLNAPYNWNGNYAVPGPYPPGPAARIAHGLPFYPSLEGLTPEYFVAYVLANLRYAYVPPVVNPQMLHTGPIPPQNGY